MFTVYNTYSQRSTVITGNAIVAARIRVSIATAQMFVFVPHPLKKLLKNAKHVQRYQSTMTEIIQTVTACPYSDAVFEPVRIPDALFNVSHVKIKESKISKKKKAFSCSKTRCCFINETGCFKGCDFFWLCVCVL